MFQTTNQTNGYGSIPIDTFLVGWTSIYQLFWCSLGTRVLTHPQMSSFAEKKNGPSFADAFQGSKLRAAKFSPGRDPSRLNVMLCLNGTDTTGDGNGCIRIYKGYPLVNSHITMERSTIFHGKSHYFYWAIFHSFLYVYQRVNVHQWAWNMSFFDLRQE